MTSAKDKTLANETKKTINENNCKTQGFQFGL